MVLELNFHFSVLIKKKKLPEKLTEIIFSNTVYQTHLNKVTLLQHNSILYIIPMLSFLSLI